MFYVYVLTNPKTGTLYYGFSANLRQRFLEHQEMPKHTGWKLVYYEAYLKSRTLVIANECSNNRELREVISNSV